MESGVTLADLRKEENLETNCNKLGIEYIAPEPVLRLIEGTDGLALAPGLPQNPRVSVYSDYLRQNVPL